jgi:hypothetical protein
MRDVQRGEAVVDPKPDDEPGAEIDVSELGA